MLIAPSKPRKRRIIPWALLVLFLAFSAWIVLSENPFAQAIQGGLGWKHDNAILDSEFTLQPRGFRFYKFSLPEGSTNVAIVGEFTSVIAETKRANGSNKTVPSSQESANIEVLVVSESAFAVWQKGYATSSVYDSGETSQAKLQQDLPAGAGVYYLLFSNKGDTAKAKTVTSTVLLRYKSWLPTWLRHLKED